MVFSIDYRRPGKIMLVGSDHNQILERRFRAAGFEVVTVSDDEEAIEHARHERLDATVLLSYRSAINVAETVFNLRDLARSMQIIILVNRLGRHSRFLRPLLQHPIERTHVLTRRQLQKELHSSLSGHAS